ncbi:MAG: hypothetical protein F4179_01155 [Gammaproteobacteria bacterium]|nr:hypothetical protein [Gammaproteobacteria bacterium]MYF60277.1 hypothetical protein [Gammaproteobacteria bacterium]
MPQIADRFQRQLEELIRAGKIQGLQLGVLQGRQEGQVLLLRRQIARKFGDDTARRLYELLDDLNSLDDIDWVTDALLKSGTGEEFIEWVRFRDADPHALPVGSTAVPGPVRGEWGLVRGRTIWACFWLKEDPETMAELVDTFQRGMDELSERGAREGAWRVLRRLATRRFGEETAGPLSTLLKELSDPEDIGKVSDALLECRTGEEFIERVRAA